MKLIGSKIESEYREELIRSHKSLFEDKEKQKILFALRERYPDMRTAYPIGWIPEQGEDIYSILIDTSLVSTVEVNRLDSESDVVIEDILLEKYKQKLSKTDRIKLAVAIDLARSDIG